MFGDWALSNHGMTSEYELWEHGNDGYYGEDIEASTFTPDPLYYHTDISQFADVITEGERFTVIKHRLDGMTLSLPNKILKVRHGKTYAHKNIYLDIYRKKKIWLAEQKAKKDGVE